MMLPALPSAAMARILRLNGDLITASKTHPKPDRPACLWCGSRRAMCATREDGENLGCDLKDRQ